MVSIDSDKDNKTPKTYNVGTKIAKKEYEKIQYIINSGLYINMADFVRDAIRSKLHDIEIINIRDIPPEQMKKEIIEYCQEKEKCDICDIADDLELDVIDVNEIVEELINEGLIGEV